MSDLATVPISQASENAVPSQYIVTLKEHSNLACHLSWLQQQKSNLNDQSSKCEVIYKFDLINGYTAKLSGPILQALTQRDDVESISEDCRPIVC